MPVFVKTEEISIQLLVKESKNGKIERREFAIDSFSPKINLKTICL